MIATRGPKTTAALNGARGEGSFPDPVSQTNERMDARKRSIDLWEKKGKKERVRERESKEGKGKEYQDTDTAGIARNTQKFHHIAVFVLLAS